MAGEFPEIVWYAYARIKGFTPDLLREAKNAGCFSLFWGVEAAHDRAVRLLGKGFKVRDMLNLIYQSADLGINNHIHVMYNTPHETQEGVAALIDLIERYSGSDYVSFIPHRFLLEPQSLIFTHPERYGLTKIEKIPLSIFEREQYRFEEEGGMDFERIRRRNEKHSAMLAPYLQKIEEKKSAASKVSFQFGDLM